MRIQLEAGADHVEALAQEHDPVSAVIELVWNGLDADAHKVEVELHRNAADGVNGVTITDDGHGMSPEEIDTDFKRIGDSWKRRAMRSKLEGRPLHGKAGRGRLRAFALGNSISWTTVAVDTGSRRIKTVVRADISARNDFERSDPAETNEKAGTVFVGLGRDGLDRLETDHARSRVTRAIAPYLIAHHDVAVTYDGTAIKPSDNVADETSIDFTWHHDGELFEGILRIIEWAEGKGQSLHLCDGDGVPVDEVREKLPAADFVYSAYILWEEMPDHQNEWMLARLEDSPSKFGTMLAVAEAKLIEHFDARRDEYRRELVEEWKEKKTYPYKVPPVTSEDKFEQAAFDVVATTIRRHVPSSRKQQSLVLGLLKEALQRGPDRLAVFLDQYVGLTEEQKDQLDRLLRQTSLARIIQASASVTDRVSFLRALRHMLFDNTARHLVKERAHLHKMLERELWVFGEQFNMMLSEKSLTAALDQHLKILGRNPSDARVVRLSDGKIGRLDIMLSAKTKDHDRIRHLVIELKAPGVVAHEKEARQIKKYARAVVADSQFADMTAEWDFILLVADMDNDVRRDITQHGRERGILDQSEIDPNSPVKYRVWIKRWNEILDEAERRIAFYQDNLLHDPSLDEIREFLHEHHRDVVPIGLLDDPNSRVAS